MIVPLLVGLLSHGFDPIISGWQNTPVQWRRLLRYAIGCFDIIGGFYYVTMKRQGKAAAVEQSERLTVVVVFVGAGVVVGYMLQELYYRFRKDGK